MAFTRKTLKERLVDYLARRDHSRRELKQKLSRHAETPEEVDAVITWADEHGYLKAPEQLTETFTRSLHRKLKGHRQIEVWLAAKGLPAPEKDSELELKKAQELATKWNIEDKAKLARRLSYRGFDSETIRKVIYEKR